jgi:uncharacterized membrane protein YhaH (DUF805 family)
MGFGDAIRSGFANYANFNGRAARSEFWYWFLFAVIVSLVTAVLDMIAFPRMQLSPLNSIAGLALFLPGIAVSIRRLHDVDRSGWWWLIVFTVIGGLLLLYWDVIKGTTGSNRFGPDPLGGV